MRKIGLIFLSLFIFSQAAYGQCAMCKAVAETGSEEISGIGEGLNLGILYLMAFPYLMIGILGYVLYKHYQKNRVATSQDNS
jgi:hypothetical protein